MTPPPIPDQPGARLGRITKLLLFAAAIFGSLVFGAIFFAIPVFVEMFSDFGAELPKITRFFISARPAYLPMALTFGLIAYHLLYGKLQKSGSIFAVLALLGLEYAIFVMSFSAMFMPIFNLSAVASK